MEKKIRYIIREIPPEQCEFSYYFDDDGIKEAGGDFCYNIFIIMRERWNRVSGFQADEYQRISDQLREIAEEIEAGPGEYFSSYKHIMEYYGMKYSPKACHELKQLCTSDDFDELDPDTVAAYLTLKTGRKWTTTSARGYCQGDYCQILYCEDHHKQIDAQAYGEIYLGAGKEFCTIELDDDGNEIDSCRGYIVADCYVRSWIDEDYKKIVCEWAGISPEETRLEMVDNVSYKAVVSYRTA